MDDEEQVARRAAQDEILARLDDLIAEDPDHAAVMLLNTIIALVAKAHPGKPSAAARRKIVENYPSATASLINERAMSPVGVAMSVSGALLLAKIALDYSPLSHVKPLTDADWSLPAEIQRGVQTSIQRTFDAGVAAGMSPFGVAATMILTATLSAQRRGVAKEQVARPLLDALTMSFEEGPLQSTAEMDEEVLAALSAQMGISRATAKKYLAQAKKSILDQGD